ncbi:uncharacterized protein B0P05DRAFT_528212 [Gilbertella persicaria]|uniref:uncharacterized protein n=1 Tax=Gilbertella persicaria TaxID=101096 RepID=UPI002220BCDA|nr:uncharacterized protein B0P05DRAFT_528212 [Gilbertella persicaria]KAI8090970.1 hypothetical protein B0P05DRAFT_528212 [Gilbertella persicaria]
MSSSHAHWNRQESYKETYDTFYKLKQDVLLLKKKSNIHWPVQTYSSKVNKIKGRHGYTNTPKHYASKLNITKVPVYKAQPWDPQLTGKRPPTRYHTTNTANYHDPIFDDVSDYVDHQLSKHKEKDTVQQENKVDLVKDLSIQLVDKVLHQMMNTQQQQAHDWEFVLSNLIQTASLPPAVIDRIQREMEMKTAKETPGKETHKPIYVLIYLKSSLPLMSHSLHCQTSLCRILNLK